MKASSPLTRRRWLAVTGMTGAASLISRTSAAVASPTRCVVDPANVITPKFDGWGVSLAWWARVAGEFPEDQLDWVLDRVFGSKDGLGLNIVRYNIGGGENPEHHSLSYRAAVEAYLSKDGTWNWNADASQRKVLLKARKLGVNQFEAFSNSPPWWMTRSGSVAGDDQGKGNLKDEMIGDFTHYLATVVKYFRDKAGLEFQTLTPLNEPLGDWWKLGGPQEGCVIPPAQQAKLIPATRAALDKLGLKTGVTGPEDNNTDHALQSLRAYSREAWGALSHINTHTYHANERAELLKLAQKHNKDIVVSEYGDGDASGIPMARTIIGDLRDLRARAWVYWQALDGGGWGLIAHPSFDHRKRPPTPEEIPHHTINPKFHVLRMFTRYLPQGCRIVSSSEAGTVAGFDPASRSLSWLVLNEGKSEKTFSLELPKGMLKEKAVSGELLENGTTRALPPITSGSDTLPVTVPPRAMAALRIRND